MGRLAAIIFDMDGVMIDSEGQQSIAVERTIREHGANPEYTAAGIVQIVGISAMDNLKRLKEKHGLEASTEELHAKKNEHYHELLKQGVTGMPGLLELLDDLKTSPIKKALASGSIKVDIDLVLEHLELQNYFDAVITGDDVAHGKPNPEIFLKAAGKLDVRPQDCVVIEDAENGVAAAKAAGMPVIAIPNRYTRNHDFDLADLVVPSLEKVNLTVLQSLFD